MIIDLMKLVQKELYRDIKNKVKRCNYDSNVIFKDYEK